MARQKRRTPATLFSATVRSALEHIADPLWLGRNSPFASPYFLGAQRLAGTRPDFAIDRGRVLQSAIHEAAARMWPGPLPNSRTSLVDAVDEERGLLGSKSPRYLYYLLELRYLRKYYPSNTFPTSAESIPGFVNVSPTRFFIHLEDAINDLGRHLLEWFSPGLRLERPGLNRHFVGRSNVVAAALSLLSQGQSVAITGTGGVGKTTVGAALISKWPGDVFWYTFRPGLNDDFGSLLFSLGHFTHEAGAPTLWAQLKAGEGRIEGVGELIGMLTMDLEAIADRQPLLCFDEVDLLQTATGSPRRKQHSQILELLDSLRGVVPFLLIGQRVYIDTNAHFPLEPLAPSDTGELLRLMGYELDVVALNRVQKITGGIPRLLELYAALRESGDDLANLAAISKEPAARPLFNRLWRRLGESEQEVLGALSIYRAYAPRDIWSKQHQIALADLINRNLVKTDLAGGIALLPFIRELVYESLPPSHRRQYHQGAAHIRTQLGDYTSAAYHFVQSGEPATAVEVWFAHQDEEILAGQSMAADEVFRQIEPRSLEGARRQELLVIQNKLALLIGEADRVLEGMEQFSWDVDDEPTANAIGQWAYAYELREQSDQALDKYDEAIAMASRLITDVMSWRLRRGFILSETDFQSAQREAELAQYDIERLLGSLSYLSGRFEQAEEHFRAMLQIAERTSNADKIARAHQQLSILAGRRGMMGEAGYHAEIAMDYFAQIGDRLQLEGMRAELAGMYLNIQQFDAVIEPAEKALRFFERIGHNLWVSTISTNLAEAYMETGRLDKARELVFKAIRMEIPTARPYALYTLGHIHDREGNTSHAITSFKEGIETARGVGDPFVEAYLQRALGALLVRNESIGDGAGHLETASKLFAGMGLEHEVAATTEIMNTLPEGEPAFIN